MVHWRAVWRPWSASVTTLQSWGDVSERVYISRVTRTEPYRQIEHDANGNPSVCSSFKCFQIENVLMGNSRLWLHFHKNGHWNERHKESQAHHNLKNASFKLLLLSHVNTQHIQAGTRGANQHTPQRGPSLNPEQQPRATAAPWHHINVFNDYVQTGRGGCERPF